MFTEMFPLCPDPHCDQRMMSLCVKPSAETFDVILHYSSQSRVNAELTLNATVNVLILRTQNSKLATF